MKNIWICCLILLCAPALQASELNADEKVSSAHLLHVKTTSQAYALQLLQAGVSPAVSALTESEILLLKATIALRAGQPNQALNVLQGYTNNHDPLLDMLEAEAYRRSAVQAVASAGDYGKGMQDDQQQLQAMSLSEGLREADVRLDAFLARLGTNEGMPLDLLQVDDSIYSIFLVDKARSRMFVYARNAAGILEQVADEYVVTGEQKGDKQVRGDARTPNGVYRFVQRLQGKKLENRYGPVAYPIDYPNALDVLHRKSGSGIWMHGYAKGVGRRPPRDTKGCFALPNPRLLVMSDYIRLGKSWVIVGNNFEFGNNEARRALRHSVQQMLKAWRKDWTTLNTPAYLAFYHDQFHSGKYDLAAWKRYKQRVNGSKSFIDIDISGLTLIHDNNIWPEGEVVVAEFNQLYRSSNYQDSSRKRLYLARTDKQQPWRILLEESLTP
ncbi:MAG: L,D-transpeptidase family protein [Mariprofundaceae bacterium]|nr:L,D-transpeptidase family protein [Mariprofundaceae bacterium]